MKYQVPDLETSNYNYGNPFDPRNYPVSISVLVGDTQEPIQKSRVYTHHFLTPSISSSSWEEIKNILEGDNAITIGHNIRFDLHWIHRIGAYVDTLLWDTMFLPYLQFRGRSKKGSLQLSTLSSMKNPLGDRLVHTHGVNPADISPKVLLMYNVLDVKATEQLFRKQIKECKEFEKPLRLMFDLLPVLVECEKNGFKVDLPLIQKMHKEQVDKRKALEIELLNKIKDRYEQEDFNLASSKQVSELIYSRSLKKDKAEIWKRFYSTFNPFGKEATNKYYEMVEECFEKLSYGLNIVPPISARNATNFSVASDILKELVRTNEGHPEFDIVEGFHEISRLDTLIGTFLEGILGGGDKGKEPKYFMEGDGGYIHTSYNQVVTGTGRLSSSNPNLQNWPREGKFPVRATIISRFPGGKIAKCDASQIELRFAAWYYPDRQMLSDLASGVDIHGECASGAYGSDYSEEDRYNSKTVVFRTLYRGGPFGIVNDPKVPIYSLEEAKRIVEVIYGRYKELQEGQERDLLGVIANNGLIHTPTGREFRFDCSHFGLKNKVANYPIQSGATADFIPCCMIVLFREMKKAKVQSLLIGQVHDDVIVDVFPGEEEIMGKLMKWALTEGGRKEFNKRFNLNFDVALDAEFKLGEHW